MTHISHVNRHSSARAKVAPISRQKPTITNGFITLSRLNPVGWPASTQWRSDSCEQCIERMTSRVPAFHFASINSEEEDDVFIPRWDFREALSDLLKYKSIPYLDRGRRVECRSLLQTSGKVCYYKAKPCWRGLGSMWKFCLWKKKTRRT